MADHRDQLVRVDGTGQAHPIGATASAEMRRRKGAFRLMPSPNHLVVMRYVGEDGKRDDEDGPIFRLSGEITTGGALCDIVALIGQAHWDGELVVLDTECKRSVFFEKGVVISATSNAVGERLGEVFYRYGAMTQEEVEQTVASVTPEMRFGETAVQLGFIKREQLFSLMGKQTEEIVYSVMRVGDGMFYFLETYEVGRLSTRLNIAVTTLLMEGVRRMDETRYFRERIPSDQHVPVRVPERTPPEEAHLTKFWDAVDGHRSVAEICRVVGMGEFETTQALFQMVQSGRVAVHAPRPTGNAAIVARFNEAMSKLLEHMDAMGKGGEVREQLSSFATGAGVYDALFQTAGPKENGTLEIDQTLENIGMLVGAEQSESMLSQWLYEYASFALFLAEPAVRQSEATGDGLAITKSVAELISPLAPKH